MEKQKIKKAGKSKFGNYLQFEDNSFKGSTEQVNRFLEGKVPCEIEIVETTGEGKDEKISKVRVLSANQGSFGSQEKDLTKLASMCVSYAKDLAVAGAIKVEEISTKASGFMELVKLLSEGKEVLPTEEESSDTQELNIEYIKIESGLNEEGEYE